MSNPTNGGYDRQDEVALGAELVLPEPWNLTVDTAKLVD